MWLPWSDADVRPAPTPPCRRLHLPAEQAAREMRVSLRVLKQVARKHGVRRCAPGWGQPRADAAAVTSRLQPARAAPPSLLPPCLPSRQPAGRAPLLLCRCWALFPRVAPGAFLGPAALFLSPYATITDLVTAPDGAPPAHPPTTLGPLAQVAVPQAQLRRRGHARERGTPGLTPPPSPRSEAPRSKLHPCRWRWGWLCSSSSPGWRWWQWQHVLYIMMLSPVVITPILPSLASACHTQFLG